MSKQDRYDELEQLIESIETLEYYIKSKDILEDIRLIKYDYEEEYEQLGKELLEDETEEMKWQQLEYDSMRL